MWCCHLIKPSAYKTDQLQCHFSLDVIKQNIGYMETGRERKVRLEKRNGENKDKFVGPPVPVENLLAGTVFWELQ